MLKEVKIELTRISRAEAFQILKEAWGKRFGTVNDRQAAIITAAWAHETGNGKSMYNYNFGGIKGSDPKSGMTVSLSTREGYGDTERRLYQNFRAYQNAQDGAEDYVALIARRYPKAARCVNNEDARGFVNELHSRGYFTGDPEAYSNSVARISREITSFDDKDSDSDDREDRTEQASEEPSGMLPRFVKMIIDAMESAIAQL